MAEEEGWSLIRAIHACADNHCGGVKVVVVRRRTIVSEQVWGDGRETRLTTMDGLVLAYAGQTRCFQKGVNHTLQ